MNICSYCPTKNHSLQNCIIIDKDYAERHCLCPITNFLSDFIENELDGEKWNQREDVRNPRSLFRHINEECKTQGINNRLQHNNDTCRSYSEYCDFQKFYSRDARRKKYVTLKNRPDE